MIIRSPRSSSLETNKFLRIPWLISITALLLAGPPVSSAARCTVCPDGTPISLPHYNFTIDGLPIDNCQSLSDTAGLIDDGTPFCDSIHATSSLCGCAYDDQTACSLCHDGSTVLYPLNEVPDYLAQDFIFGAPDNVVLNCESLEAILHQRAKNSSTCIDAQNYAFGYCGCPEPPGSNTTTAAATTTQTNETSMSGNDEATLETEFCSVCIDGEPISLPDRPLVVNGLPIETCSDLANFAGFLETTSDECVGIQTIGTYCGCSYQEHDATICSDGSDLPLPDAIIPWIGEGYTTGIPDNLNQFADSLTCGIFEAALQNFDETNYGGVQYNFLVLATQLRSGVCGCSHGWRAKLLTWAHRIAGALSFLGSLVITIDILTNPQKRFETYHQLVLGMSVFDMMNSAAFTASTSMISPDSGLYQATGSDATCTLQGFMIQFALTSCFFNAMLATYFMLATTRGWKESFFRKFRYWAYLLAVSLGLGLAIAGLRFYTPLLAVCYVSVPPVTQTWTPITLLFTVPVALSIFIATVSLILICRKVFQIELKAMRWLTRQDAGLAKKVCYRTFWYLLSFNVTLPCSMLSFYFGGRTAWGGYAVFVIAGMMSPLQGLLNACVYYQRNRKRMWCNGLCGILTSGLNRITHTETSMNTNPHEHETATSRHSDNEAQQQQQQQQRSGVNSEDDNEHSEIP